MRCWQQVRADVVHALHEITGKQGLWGGRLRGEADNRNGDSDTAACLVCPTERLMSERDLDPCLVDCGPHETYMLTLRHGVRGHKSKLGAAISDVGGALEKPQRDVVQA